MGDYSRVTSGRFWENYATFHERGLKELLIFEILESGHESNIIFGGTSFIFKGDKPN